MSSGNFYFLSSVKKIMPKEVIPSESVCCQWKNKTSWRLVGRSLIVDVLFVSLYSVAWTDSLSSMHSHDILWPMGGNGHILD